ncbi:MAG TPA: response regulator, partial [Longimicrobiales bacterium]
SGGYIWVYSEPGQGTTFEVYLPRVEAVAEEPETPRPHPEPHAAPGGSEVVLVVEDEDAVRTLIRKVLEQKGYTVLEARDGQEAIRLSEGHDGPIDLAISDMIMPGMGGRELAARLRSARPGLKVLFISGYTGFEIAKRGLLEPGTPMLEKPFTPQALARMVREVLGEGDRQTS